MIITRAAIMFSNGEIVEGHNYASISTIAHKLSYMGDKIFGFITSTGDFVLPQEANDIALEAGQISTPNEDLKPEDLWPQWADE